MSVMWLVKLILRLGIEKYIKEEKKRGNRKRLRNEQRQRLRLKLRGGLTNRDGKHIKELNRLNGSKNKLKGRDKNKRKEIRRFA